MSNPSTPLGVRPVRAFADNYIWLIESPRRARPRGRRRPGRGRTRHRRARSQRCKLSRDFADSPSSGSYRRASRNCCAWRRCRSSGRTTTGYPQRTRTVRDGERCELPDLGLTFDILHVPGHTLSHIAFWGHGALFCGDTLFSAGCGRMFEGTPTQMSASLNRLSGLPPETDIFCGHEYTAANLRFALTVDPANAAALEYRDRVARLRTADIPTLPSRMSLEIRVNPFLRCDAAAVRAAPRRTRTALCAIRPRSLPYCAPGRTGSVSGTHGAAR